MHLNSKASCRIPYFRIRKKGISGKLILLFLCVILYLRFPANIRAEDSSKADIGEEQSSDIMSLDMDDEFMPDESPFCFQLHYKNLFTYFSTDNYLDENENRF